MTPSPTFPVPPAPPARAARHRFRTALVAAGLAFAGLSAAAETPTYTYTYVGKNFNVFNTSPSLYAPTAHVTFAFVFTAPLAANLNLGGPAPASWTATDTVNRFSSSTFNLNDNVNSTDFRFSTNAVGNITGWILQVRHDSAGGFDLVQSASMFRDLGGYYLLGSQLTAEIISNPGSWTLAVSNPVPEAATGWMLAAGLLGLGGLMQRRRSAATGPLTQPA